MPAANAGVPPLQAEEPDQAVLRQVGVLELIDQDEVEAVPPRLQPVGMLVEEPHRMQEQVIEVHRVGGLERRSEAFVHRGGGLHHQVERAGARQLVGLHHPVLGPADDPRDGARGHLLLVVPQVVEQPADEGVAVVLIVDRELPGEAEDLGLAAEESGAQAVEGPDPEPGRVATQQTADPLLHLPRRLVGEGDGEDPVGADPVRLDEPGDPEGEHPWRPSGDVHLRRKNDHQTL